MPGIRAILFDADGVLQRPSCDVRALCTERFGVPADDVDRFFADVYAMERPLLVGGGDFRAALTALLERWRIPAPFEDVASVWTAIEVDPAMRRAILGLRGEGYTCCLATNQQEFRRDYMSRELGYAELFTREFYSCSLGHAKPDPDYFRVIAAELDLAPAELLFIDDHAPNVAAARTVGLHAALFSASAATSRGVLHAILAEHGIVLR